LVEHNIVEGASNNVLGTWHCAEAAIKAGVESFVLVSTDKAVRPTNIMGASKRMAELVLQGLTERQSTTRFSMVRFGNVLGSSGSVVPLFREQIKQGGPVTVTHPDILRYFMTIPEAAELVMQAGSMGEGGDVFVLDMGKPIKIVDLAKKMIHLSGLKVKDNEHIHGDIEIQFTGLRPGEKLYEELLIGDNISGTNHELIMRAEEKSLNWHETKDLLEELSNYCDSFQSNKVKELFLTAPTDYQADSDMKDWVWSHKQEKLSYTSSPTKRMHPASHW
jgi:FlaA1/EpsC-like NDP-sugar epimerase